MREPRGIIEVVPQIWLRETFSCGQLNPAAKIVVRIKVPRKMLKLCYADCQGKPQAREDAIDPRLHLGPKPVVPGRRFVLTGWLAGNVDRT